MDVVESKLCRLKFRSFLLLDFSIVDGACFSLSAS